MKKLFVVVLFFASFSVAMGAQLSGLDQWFKILGIKKVTPPISTVAISSVQNANKCNDPDEIAHCNTKANGDGNGGNTCSGIYSTRNGLVYTDGNPPRCGGVRRGNDNYNMNPCRPLGCPIRSTTPSPKPSAPKPVPQSKPQPILTNCLRLQIAIKELKKRVDGLPDNDYFRGIREELKKQLEKLTSEYARCEQPKSQVSGCSGIDTKEKCVAKQCSWCTGNPYKEGGECTTSCDRKCLSSSSKIATPIGDIRVTELKIGDIVWTTDAAGNRIVRSLIKASHIAAPNHRVVHLVLMDGRTLDVSALHPTANSKTVGDLKIGDGYDGSTVKSAELKPYEGTATYDILPAGDTGLYFANGILMGSTLK